MVATRQQPIVVGVDSSAGAKAALRFALDEGNARQTGVHVVTTWHVGPPLRETLTDTVRAEQEAEARRVQDDVLAAVAADLDTLPEVQQSVAHDFEGQALVDAARDGSMLVVGSGHKGVVARTVLGSVSEYCVRHASVPVVVVPG